MLKGDRVQPDATPPLLEYRAASSDENTLALLMIHCDQGFQWMQMIGFGFFTWIFAAWVLYEILFFIWERVDGSPKDPGWLLAIAALLPALVMWRLLRARRVKIILRDGDGDTTLMVFNVKSPSQVRKANALIGACFGACLLSGEGMPQLLALRRGSHAVAFDGRARGVRYLIVQMPSGAPLISLKADNVQSARGNA